MIDTITRELGNIGVVVVSTVVEGPNTTLLVQGKANKRKASCSIPNGIVSDAEEASRIETALASVRQQITSNSGEWPND